MASTTAFEASHAAGRARAREDSALYSEAWLRRRVEALYRRALARTGAGRQVRQGVVDAIVRLGMQPDILAALRGRRDPAEAVRDLATRYAFAELMVQGRAFQGLDPLSQALIQRTLDIIYKRARRVEKQVGEDPLDGDPGLLPSLCKTLSHYLPRKPMGAHISWKLRHYEGPVSRLMRQIQHLVCCPEVTEAFVAHVLAQPAKDELKAGLLQMARGGGRSGVDCEEAIRFFARPEMVAFVKRFAGTVQTARTLYAEEEYHDILWQGKRRLPLNRRQGYLDAALSNLERLHEESLDNDKLNLHELLSESSDQPGSGHLHSEPFECWVTRQALEERPDDPLWQAAALHYVQKLPSREILDQGLASASALEAARERMEALRANPDVWQAWMEATLA